MTALFFMAALSFLAFFLAFLVGRDKSHVKMLGELEKLGLSQKDIILSSKVEILAENKESGNIFYSKALGVSGVKSYTFPVSKISRWYEHEKKENKETIHLITVVIDIEDIGEVTFSGNDRKVIAKKPLFNQMG